MKKLYVFAAITLIAGAAQAQSQFSIYGLIDLSYGKSILDDHDGKKADFHSGGDASGIFGNSSQGNSTSRVGLKGSTDVGSGVKANFKLETGGITSNGEVNPGGAFFSRAAWAGLSGAFGEVRLGRQDSIPFQATIDYDFNGASNGVSSAGYAGVATWGPGRQSRSLQYIAPKFGDVTVQVGFQPKGNDAGVKSNGSIGVTYATGPLAATLAYQSKSTPTGDDFTALAARYDFKVAKVSLGYADGGKNAKGVSAGVVVPVAGFDVGLQYARNSDTKGVAYELFVSKEVFKNLYGYVQVGHADAKTGFKGTGYNVGAIYVF
jgi:predicted porin